MHTYVCVHVYMYMYVYIYKKGYSSDFFSGVWSVKNLVLFSRSDQIQLPVYPRAMWVYMWYVGSCNCDEPSAELYGWGKFNSY